MRKQPLAHAPTHYHDFACCCTPKAQTRRPRWEKTLTVLLYAAALILAALFVLLACAGCASHEITRQVRTAQDSARLQAAAATTQATVDVAKVEAAARVNDAKGTVAPVSHPIAAVNVQVKRQEKPLEVVAPVAFLLFLASVGLWFTPLSFISKLAVPITGMVALGSFLGLIALPFLPWVGLAAAAVPVVLFAYEWIRLKSPGKAFDQIKADVDSELYGNTAGSPAASFNPAGPASSLSSIEAAAVNELHTLTADAAHVLGLAGSKAAPIVTTSPPPPPPAPTPVPAVDE